MKAITYWLEPDGKYLGFLNDYPDHWTRGEDLDDLKKHLRDLFEIFDDESTPGKRKEEEVSATTTEEQRSARPVRLLEALGDDSSAGLDFNPPALKDSPA